MFNVLVYLHMNGQMPGIKLSKDSDPEQMFEEIKAVRKSQSANDYCFDEMEDLTILREEIFSYTFKEKPNYKKIRGMLEGLR